MKLDLALLYRNRWVQLVAIVLATACAAAFFGYQTFFAFQLKARDGEARATLSAYRAALEAYRDSSGTYDHAEASAIGYRPEDGTHTVHISETSLPPEIRKVLDGDRLPYLGRNDYRIVVLDDLEDGVRVWFAETNANPDFIDLKRE